MVSSPSGVGLSMTTLRDVRHRGIAGPSARRLGRRNREKVRGRSGTGSLHHERDNAKAGARQIPGQRRTAVGLIPTTRQTGPVSVVLAAGQQVAVATATKGEFGTGGP